MDTFKWSQELVEELIMHYRIHENLYVVADPSYLDKYARASSLKEIMLEMRKLSSDITVPIIKTKINTMRTQYWKELKKVQWSKKSGAKEVYKPRLWFYNYLHFLRPNYSKRAGRARQSEVPVPQFEDVIVDEEETVASSSPNITMERYDSPMNNNFENSKKQSHTSTPYVRMNIEPHSPDSPSKSAAINDQHPPLKSAKGVALELAVKQLRAIIERLNQPSEAEHEFDCFGKLVACILRQLPPAEAQGAMLFIQQDLVQRRLKYMQT